MKHRSGLLVCCLIFGLGFGGFGALALKSMADTLASWWTARGWVAVSAQVVQAAQGSRSGDTGSETAVRYSYQFNGRHYQSTRLELTKGDFVVKGTSQRHSAGAAPRKGDLLTVWVNPAEPSQAVLSRRLHPGPLLFLLPFATVFPLVGLGALWGAWRVIRASPRNERTLPLNPARISSDERQEARGLAVFALLWNLLTMPIAALVLLEHPGLGKHAFILIFPLIGLALIGTLIRGALARRRLGTTLLTLSPAQPTLGQPLIARIEFEKPPGGPLSLQLMSEQVDRRGKQGSTRTRLLWEQEVRVRAANKTLSCQFEPPADGQASEAEGRHFARWFLRLNWPDGRQSRDFPLTITQARPNTLNTGTAGASTPGPARSEPSTPEPVELPSALATLTPLPGGLRLDYAPDRHRGLARAFLVVGAIFCGFVFFVSGGLSLLTLVFFALGLGLLIAGVRHWDCPLRVEASPSRLTVRGRILMKEVDQHWPAGAVRRIEPMVTSTSGGHPRQRYVYALQAELTCGTKVILGDGIASRAVADLLIRRLEEALRPRS